MGGAPPLPHDFAPEGVKNRKKLCDFGPPEAGGPLGPEGRRTWVREPRGGQVGSSRSSRGGVGGPGNPGSHRAQPGENEHGSVADSAPAGRVGIWRSQQEVVLMGLSREREGEIPA